jgi:hypothetical protein
MSGVFVAAIPYYFGAHYSNTTKDYPIHKFLADTGKLVLSLDRSLL